MSRLKRIEDVFKKAKFKSDQEFIKLMMAYDKRRNELIAEKGIEYIERIDKEIANARH